MQGSATLSMAYSAARMAESTLLGLNGEPNVYECAFVSSDVSPLSLLPLFPCVRVCVFSHVCVCVVQRGTVV